jgi:hypothetical protein
MKGNSLQCRDFRTEYYGLLSIPNYSQLVSAVCATDKFQSWISSLCRGPDAPTIFGRESDFQVMTRA